MSPVRNEDVLKALATVQDPDLHKDIVALGFVKDVRIDGGQVDFTIELTTPACPVRDEMKAEAEQKVAALAGVTAARAQMTANVRARGGFGVMVDDLIAGLYALAVIAIVRAAVGWP